MQDVFFMEKALLEARKAYANGDVPIGAILVKDNEIIAKGYNQRNKQKNALYHAEIIVIDKACKYLADWRLENTTLYVTIEPCPMCAGAILQARIPKVVFGATNQKAGSVVSVFQMFQTNELNHQVETFQVLERRCGQLMTDFFRALRQGEI